MLTMLSLTNKKYIAFFKLGDEEKAEEMRKKNPKMKHARITRIIQANPSIIVLEQVYER